MNGRPAEPPPQLRDATPAFAAGEAFAALVAPLYARLDALERRVAGLDGPDWMTIEQAAEHVHATPGALRKRAERGQLPGAVRDGARWLVDRRALDSALVATTVRSDNANGRAPSDRPRPGNRR